jgi:hypothetical protein
VTQNRIEYRLAPARIGISTLAGALAGAAIVSLHWLTTAAEVFGLAFVAGEGLHGLLVVFMGAILAWLAALILIGGPTWWLLHRHRLRGWRAAMTAGVAATFAAGMILAVPLPHKGGSFSRADRGGLLVENDQLTAYGWQRAAEGALLLSFVGGAVALVVWRIAYRRA